MSNNPFDNLENDEDDNDDNKCSENIIMYFDGGSRSNGLTSGAGCYIEYEHGKIIYEGYKFLGNTTNNVAEYNGLILGLKNLNKYHDSKIIVKGDSKLVIEQINENWKVRAIHLIPLWKEAKNLAKNFKDISFIHIDRSLNSKADKLANIAIQTKSDSFSKYP